MPSDTKSGVMNAGAANGSPSAARKRRGFFGWFFRGKSAPQPVRIDTATKTAEAPIAKAVSAESAVAAPPAERRKSSERAIDRLEKGYQEVTELVGALRQHIDRQADRSERLLEKLENLPEALASLPKVNQTNHELLDTMRRHLDQQQEHSVRLTQVIDGLVHASKHRDDAIDMLRQQFEATREKDVQLMSGFATLGENMSKICDFQQKTASVLDRVIQMGAAAEQRMRDMLEINKRNARTLAMSGWALVVVSLAMTAFVAIAATRLASYPAAPAAGQPVADRPAVPAPAAATRAQAPPATEPDLTVAPAVEAPAPAAIATPAATSVSATQSGDPLAAFEITGFRIDWSALADLSEQIGKQLAPMLPVPAAATEGPVSATDPVDDAEPIDLDAVVERVVAGGSE